LDWVASPPDGQYLELHYNFSALSSSGNPVSPIPSIQVTVRDLPTPVDVQGDGPPILFIHGFPLDRTMWRRLMSSMTGWKRIAPDLRGFGMNEAPPDPPTIAAYVDDLVDLLNQMGHERAVICGLSMGGYIAFDLVRRFPGRVRALVLANTRAASDDDAARQGRNAMARLVENDGLEALAGVLLPKMLAPDLQSTQPQVVDLVRKMINSASIPGVVAALVAMRDRPDSAALLSDIQVPTLVVSGREDAIIPASESKHMAEAIPGAHYTVIPDAGHLTPVEQPIATGRVVGEFLEALA
jgi:pimeloyl-ACP methyl ester carboxylesterase